MIDYRPLINIFKNAFDTDKIDIGRRGTITGDDGWEVEISPTIPIYENISCHIEPETMDNPDVANDPTKPIITTFKVFCPPNTDIKNGDYITLKTCDVTGEILEIQTGIAGEPRQYVGRIEFSVGVQKWI